LELVAENLIAHFLQRHRILVAKPHCDQEGGDLLAMTTAEYKYTASGGIGFGR